MKIKTFDEVAAQNRSRGFSKFVTRHKKVGEELIAETEPFNTDEAIQQYADCALSSILDRFLSVENVDLGSGFREPYVDPADMGEVAEFVSEGRSVLGDTEGYSAQEIFEKIMEVKKGAETQKNEPQGEQTPVQQDGAESA